MKSARMQKKAGNNVMGMIRAAGLGYEYLRYEEEGQEPEVTKAIEDVSLEIQKGQFIAVLGHNGSGKSTLAKHINALLVPTEGTMWVDDMKTTDEEDVWKIRQKAGMVFQNPDNQIIGNVVEEDVGFGPENLGVPTDEIWKRVEESLTATGMISYRAHSPNKLSGGQKQRVAIAGVMAMQPECIVLDEPTAMLDPNGRKEVLRAVRKLNEEKGVTVILITHYMEEVVFADRVFVMDSGRLVMQGTPREIFSEVEKLKELRLDVPQVTLEHINLEIPNVQFVGIIGHTGSGKSTLVQHLNGLIRPTAGRVLYNGEDIWKEGYPLRELRSHVGLVFQYPEHQLFETDVITDVCFGPKNQGLSPEECRKRAEEALDHVGFPKEMYEKSPFELSGGQKRRVAIAGVLAMNPDFLVLDEPTAGLDPKGRDEILDQLALLHKTRGISVVLVSHSMEDIAKYVERIIVMNHGHVAFDDTPKKVFAHYKELEKIGLAAPQMTYIMHALKEHGMDVDVTATTVEEARDTILAALKSQKKNGKKGAEVC